MKQKNVASVDASSGLASLAQQLDGALYLPSDEGWDAARTAWQLAVDQHPEAVVEAAGAPTSSPRLSRQACSASASRGRPPDITPHPWKT